MRYLGSKKRHLGKILPIIQGAIDDNDIHAYLEPFVGGANVLSHVKCDRRFGYDANELTIELLRHVRDGGELLPSVSRDEFNKARDEWRNGTLTRPLWQYGNICWLASFGNKGWQGSYAEPKCKSDPRRDIYQECVRNIMAQRDSLTGCVLEVSDYRDVKLPDERCVVYCDPPYNCPTQYENVSPIDYSEYYDLLLEWHDMGHIVICSEYSMPDDFECILEIPTKANLRNIVTQRYADRIERLFVPRGQKL